MKLLFFPALLVYHDPDRCRAGADGAIPAGAGRQHHGGAALIPVLYYTYTGILGRHVLWADIAMFLSGRSADVPAGQRLRRRRRLWEPWQQAAGLLWLWGLAFLFVWWTFRPPISACF